MLSILTFSTHKMPITDRFRHDFPFISKHAKPQFLQIFQYCKYWKSYHIHFLAIVIWRHHPNLLSSIFFWLYSSQAKTYWKWWLSANFIFSKFNYLQLKYLRVLYQYLYGLLLYTPSYVSYIKKHSGAGPKMVLPKAVIEFSGI